MARLALVGPSHHANILISRLIDIDILISQSMLNIDLRSTTALQIDGQATLETAYFGSEGSGTLSEVEIKPHAIAHTVKCSVDTVYRT
jgi:hypothetical protein